MTPEQEDPWKAVAELIVGLGPLLSAILVARDFERAQHSAEVERLTRERDEARALKPYASWLLGEQRELPADVATILHKNAWDLYE